MYSIILVFPTLFKYARTWDVSSEATQPVMIRAFRIFTLDVTYPMSYNDLAHPNWQCMEQGNPMLIQTANQSRIKEGSPCRPPERGKGAYVERNTVKPTERAEWGARTQFVGGLH